MDNELIAKAKYRIEDAISALEDARDAVDEIDTNLDENELVEIFDDISEAISEARSEIAVLDKTCDKLRAQLF